MKSCSILLVSERKAQKLAATSGISHLKFTDKGEREPELVQILADDWMTEEMAPMSQEEWRLEISRVGAMLAADEGLDEGWDEILLRNSRKTFAIASAPSKEIDEFLSKTGGARSRPLRY